ncbi:MAG TPA: DUF192 domain-containing protein [Nitrososphaera sp.]|nr:DUF192 domain-containing protein [Nitrososphaera sp.]
MRIITIIAIAMAVVAAVSGMTLYFLPIISAQVDHVTEAQHDEPVAATNSSLSTNNGYQQVNVTVNHVKLVADIASNEEQMTKGLAVKDHLNENEAMLFVFTTPGNHGFWMKDMKFPIDIIWMNANKTVVHIEHSLNPCTPISCPIYQPNSDSLYVLETVAGFANRYNVTEGTTMEFDL